MDRDAWWSPVHGVISSWIWLSHWTHTILNCANRGCCRDTLRKGLVFSWFWCVVIAPCSCYQWWCAPAVDTVRAFPLRTHGLGPSSVRSSSVVFQKQTQALPLSCLQESWFSLFTCLLTLAACTLEDVSCFLVVLLSRAVHKASLLSTGLQSYLLQWDQTASFRERIFFLDLLFFGFLFLSLRIVLKIIFVVTLLLYTIFFY